MIEIREHNGRVFVSFHDGPFIILTEDGVQGLQYTPPPTEAWASPAEQEKIADGNYEQGQQEGYENGRDMGWDEGWEAAMNKAAEILSDIPDAVEILEKA